MLKKITALSLLITFTVVVYAEQLGSVSTKFHVLGPNDKVVIEAFDDPAVPGVTCYLSRAKTGGMSGAVGLAEDRSQELLSGLIEVLQDLGRGAQRPEAIAGKPGCAGFQVTFRYHVDEEPTTEPTELEPLRKRKR